MATEIVTLADLQAIETRLDSDIEALIYSLDSSTEALVQVGSSLASI